MDEEWRVVGCHNRLFEQMRECVSSLASRPGFPLTGITEMRRPARVKRSDVGESGFEPEQYQITLARRPASRVRCGQAGGEGSSPRHRWGWCPDRRDSHPHRVVVCPRRPVLVDHGCWCGDAVLCESLLSYAVRRRAANAHTRLKEKERAGEIRTRDLRIR